MSRRTTIGGRQAYLPTKAYAALTSGDAVRVFRELQEMTQSELAAIARIGQATISSIESGRLALGVERAKRLAIALHVHPAALLFPNWEQEAKKLSAS